MPGTNLTREEARGRAAVISNVGYDVALDLTVASTTRFGSITTLTFDAVEGASTFVDLVDADIVSITLNGNVVAAPSYVDGRINLSGLAAHNTLVVDATCTYSHSGEGLHRFVDPADDKVYLYTQFEVPDARRVFATFEQPDLKARFTFHITAPAHWAVVSNSPTPEPEPANSPGDGSTAVWHFAPTAKISTYITALVAGEYVSVTDTYTGAYGSIPLGVYCRQSLREHLDADDILLITKQGFDLFESTFHMGYPFGKYDQMFVPEYNMGAMENAGCVTFRDEYIFRSRQTVASYESRSNTILHEMAHMWFGDLVTMKWWDDLWLNESFAEFAATYANANATQYTDAWTTFTANRKNWAYRQDQLPTTHPIAADNYDLHAVEANFDGITYAKGASALRQLVAWVGEEDFFAGLRQYFAKHAYGNTELADLLIELEEASGRELQPWAAEWLQTSGVNTLSASFETDESGAFTSFAIKQTADASQPTLRRHRIGVGLYSTVDGVIKRTDSVEIDVHGALTDVPQLVGKSRPDLLLVNDRDLTYAKIRLDDRSLESLTSGIATIEDSLARSLCWASAWDMTRDAQLPSATFVDLVLAGVGKESELAAVSSLLAQAQTAVRQFTSPPKQAALAGRWEAGLRTLLDHAEPGSDHQLTFARAYCTAAGAPRFLLAMLAGEVAGLTVDADLRWTIVTGLARLGTYGDDEIALELQRDNTSTGKEHAARALASRPTAAAKAEAWARVAEDSTTPNETRRQTALGFIVPGQQDVLAPYVDKYLDMANTIIDRMGVWIGQVALIYLFPSSNPSDGTLAKIDAWLDTTHAPAAAVRYVREGRDDLARALRARAVN